MANKKNNSYASTVCLPHPRSKTRCRGLLHLLQVLLVTGENEQANYFFFLLEYISELLVRKELGGIHALLSGHAPQSLLTLRKNMENSFKALLDARYQSQLNLFPTQTDASHSALLVSRGLVLALRHPTHRHQQSVLVCSPPGMGGKPREQAVPTPRGESPSAPRELELARSAGTAPSPTTHMPFTRRPFSCRKHTMFGAALVRFIAYSTGKINNDYFCMFWQGIAQVSF